MSTTELVWSQIYDDACHAFGNSTAGPQLETNLIEHFERHPAAVTAAIEKLTDRYVAGKVHTPWPLVLKELERADKRETVTANIGSEREQAIHLAETYITNAALYCPTEEDVLDDTFGPHGRLKQWADDQALRDRIAQHWQAQQPRAEQAQTEMLERAATYRAQHAAVPAVPQVPDPASSPDDDIPY